MTLFHKALSYLFDAKRDAHKHMEKKYAAFKQFVQKCNRHDEKKERSSALTNIEVQLDEHV